MNSKVEHRPEERKDEIRQINLNVLFVGIAILVVTIAYGTLIFDYKERGTFGDMFGGVNALFSGFAFVGVIYAILLQRKELEYQREELVLQREELEATRQEVAGQRVALEDQNRTLEIQRFENKFFQLLDSQRTLVSTLYAPGISQQGVRCFRELFEKFWTSLGDKYTTPDSIHKYFSVYRVEYIDPIYHYLLNVQNMLNFLEDSETSYSYIDDFSFYANIIKSQMSIYELYWIVIFCYYHLGKEEFRRIVVKYHIIDSKKLLGTPSPLINQLIRILSEEHEDSVKN